MIIDLHIVLTILGIATLGGIIGLDRTAAGQFMISQPIVAGPVTGWILGDAGAGLAIGAVLELIWVLDIPVGTFVPADSTICAVSSTAIAVLAGKGRPGPDLIGFSILLTTPMVPVTMIVDRAIRTCNGRLAERALSASPEAVGGALFRVQLEGLAVFFLKSFVLYLLFIPAGLLAAQVFARLPVETHAAMALFLKVLPLLGSALILAKLSIKTLDRFFLAGFVVAATFTAALHASPTVIVLIVITAGFLGARYREGFR